MIRDSSLISVIGETIVAPVLDDSVSRLGDWHGTCANGVIESASGPISICESKGVIFMSGPCDKMFRRYRIPINYIGRRLGYSLVAVSSGRDQYRRRRSLLLHQCANPTNPSANVIPAIDPPIIAPIGRLL